MNKQAKTLLYEWFQQQLSQKHIKIKGLQELSNGNCFIELIHLFHPKAVDLSKAYIKPKNKYQVLQNYKQLLQIFLKLGWKKFDPQKYANEKQNDYLAMGNYLKKTLTATFNEQKTLPQQEDEQQFSTIKQMKKQTQNINPNSGIATLQNRKKQLLGKISKIQFILKQDYEIEQCREQLNKLLVDIQ